MKYFDWEKEKNQKLKEERTICFEDVLIAISENRILDILENQNQNKYYNQKILIVDIKNYAYLIPFVEQDEALFLKTIIPSRKATKKYLLNS